MERPEIKSWLAESPNRTINQYYARFGVSTTDFSNQQSLGITKPQRKTKTLFWILIVIIICLTVGIRIRHNNSILPTFAPKLSTSDLANHIFLTKGNSDDIIFSLNFLDEKEVVVSIYGFGAMQQPYVMKDSIVTIYQLPFPLKYKVLDDHQLKAIVSPTSNKTIMELRK